jgi:hypothetical protein
MIIVDFITTSLKHAYSKVGDVESLPLQEVVQLREFK